jgi:NAD(P)-dependent dehydrogenase (short-subunit alcohol dehydrogenase family)
MTQRLSGKVALVTGAASGLGEAMSRRFIAEGASVVLTDIDEATGSALARELGAAARFQRHDVTREADWVDALNLAKTAFGKLDVLVNNAGITTMGSVEDLTVDQFRHMLDIDLIGVFLGCKHCIPFMKGSGGSVINISSMSGLRARHDLAGYNAAKAGVTHLTKSVALHYARQRYGIRCNSVHPGVIETEMIRKVLAQVPNPEEIYAGFVAAHPIGRIGQPHEIGSIAVYLASDESAFATGAEFVIDGGSSL